MKRKKPKRRPRVDRAEKAAEFERRLSALEQRQPLVIKVERCPCHRDDQPPPQPSYVPTAPQQPWWPPGTVTCNASGKSKIGTIVWGEP